MLHFDAVSNYAMKCRLYASPSQKKAIDDALIAVKVFHNCLVYDMWTNHINVIEKAKKTKDGVKTDEVVHFPDWKAALSRAYKDRLIEEHPIIKKCPQAALTTNVGLKADLTREFGTDPIEYQKPRYYNELHPRLSYTYQETLSKVQASENKNVFYITLATIGRVKVRGWNQKLRFMDESTDFLQWAAANPKEKITVTVSKDLTGDYYIVFKLKKCLKPFTPPPAAQVGIDVGVKDLVVCSDGHKYENKKFKKAEKRHQRMLNRRLSRQWGPSNEVYREARKQNRALTKRLLNQPDSTPDQPLPPPIVPSKRYTQTRIKHARLNRSISRKRDAWNHLISHDIVAQHNGIAVETLNISGMVRNKHLSFALTDAAFGSLLQYIRYKAEWHQRTVYSIDKWTPSSKRCSNCGYIYDHTNGSALKPWSLSIRNWVCPQCSTHHDRDINAAINILHYALNPA